MSGYYFVELYVGMAKMVVYWHCQALGFKVIGIKKTTNAGQEKITYWLKQGEINLWISSAMSPANHEMVSFVDRHGNAIKKFAILYPKLSEKYEHLIEQGLIPLSPVFSESDHFGTVNYAVFRLFDENHVIFIDKTSYQSHLLPGFEACEYEHPQENLMDEYDHLASVLRINETYYWENYLNKLADFERVQQIGEEHFTELSTGMQMTVLRSKEFQLNHVLVEPLIQKSRMSQVDLFLQHHNGSGIQHLAFNCSDIFKTIKACKKNGVVFNPVLDEYYEQLKREHPEWPVEEWKKYGVLCEQDGDSLLFQIFTEPIGDRPTLFYELIQRVNGFSGFGENNVKQLFTALENKLNT